MIDTSKSPSPPTVGSPCASDSSVVPQNERNNSPNNNNRRQYKKRSPPVPENHECSNCGTRSTPLWRTGPLGSKTLCNACGVKWTKGKLDFSSDRYSPTSDVQRAATSMTTNTSIQDVEMKDQAIQEKKSNNNLLGKKRNINGTFVNNEDTSSDAQMDMSAEYEETHQEVDSEFDNSEDEDDDDEDKELKYYDNLYNSAGLFHFNSSNARVEKPSSIMLRACNIDANWNLKEVLQLRDELRRFYEMTRRRCKLVKRDHIKLKQYEEDSGKYFVSRKNAKQFTSSPDKTLASLIKQRPNKICGVVNSRGKPCQRSGFCPFHHRLSSSLSSKHQADDDKTEKQDKIQEEPSSVVLMTEQTTEGADFKSKIQLARTQADKELDMQFSVLLIAAAAIERREIDQEEERKVQQSTTTMTTTTTTTTTATTMIPQQQEAPVLPTTTTTLVQNTTAITNNLATLTSTSTLSSLFPSATLMQQPAPIPIPMQQQQQPAPNLFNAPENSLLQQQQQHHHLQHHSSNNSNAFLEPPQHQQPPSFLQAPTPPNLAYSHMHQQQQQAPPPIPSMNQLKNLFYDGPQTNKF